MCTRLQGLNTKGHQRVLLNVCERKNMCRGGNKSGTWCFDPDFEVDRVQAFELLVDARESKNSARTVLNTLYPVIGRKFP